MYASMCEQMRLITECVGKLQVTSEEMQRVVEQVKSMRMVMAGVREHATSEDFQCMEEMREGLKNVEEEARTRQEEVRAKGTEEQDATTRLVEEVGGKATREGKGKGNGGKGEHAY